MLDDFDRLFGLFDFCRLLIKFLSYLRICIGYRVFSEIYLIEVNLKKKLWLKIYVRKKGLVILFEILLIVFFGFVCFVINGV